MMETFIIVIIVVVIHLILFVKTQRTVYLKLIIVILSKN